MEHWIKFFDEPRQLYLAWQAPDHMGTRYRWAVGIINAEPEGRSTLRYFEPGPEFERVNQGHTFAEITALGYEGYPGFKPKTAVHSDVVPAFMRRMPPRTRPDFAEYMRGFRLPADANPSDFSLLGQTEAKLPSDGFSLVDPLNPMSTCRDLVLEVAGLRYYVDPNAPLDFQVGTEAEISPEIGNPFDPNAVQITVGGKKIGNINRLQAETFLFWLRNRSVSAVVERLNGKPGWPRAFVFVSVRPIVSRAAA